MCNVKPKLQEEIDENVKGMVENLMAKAHQLRQNLLYVVNTQQALDIILEQHKLLTRAYREAQANGLVICISNGKYSISRYVH